MKELIGRKIISIEVDRARQHYIRFVTDQGPIIYLAVGDCCSESWFYHILGVDVLIGHTVAQCESISMGEIVNGQTRQEYDNLYKIVLTTEAGQADIEFRNSSNGYYGGWLELEKSPIDPAIMAAVVQDYTAGDSI